MRLGILTSRIRVEEKLLIKELERRGVPYERIDDNRFSIAPGEADVEYPFDLVFERSLSWGRSVYALRFLENHGVRCINRADVVAVCGDKIETAAALERAGVPMPRTRVAFSRESALVAAEDLGFPVVLKPAVGSWGRLVARLNDRDAAEAVFEDRATLGSWQHGIFYLQEFVEKPDRDIRVFVVGDDPIAGIYRRSEHWITNTARGATTENCPVTGDVGDLALRAAAAVGGGVLAVDLAETKDGDLVVLEVNHNTEFRNSIDVTGVDIPARIVDHLLNVMEGAPA